MSDNDKRDLTRIEDLSEFLHSEDDDDLSDIEAALSGDNESLAQKNDNDGFSDMATDPDINVPNEFSSQEDQETDFAALENSDDTFSDEETTFEEPPPAPDEDTFDNEFENSDSFESEDQFTSEDDFESSNDFDNDKQSNLDESSDFNDDSFEGDNEFNTQGSFESEDQFDSEDDFETTNDFTNDEESDFNSSSEFGDDQDVEFSEEQDSDEDNFSNNFDQVDNFDASSSDDQEVEAQQEDVFESDDEFETPDLPEEAFEEPQEEEVAFAPEPLPTPDHSQEQVEPPTQFGDVNKTSLPTIENSDGHKPPENFKELQHFAKNMSFGNMAQEGNPPFSIILKDIKYQEDVDDIIRLLVEYKIINEEDRQSAHAGLSRGSMLIPRLGEFAAISLCHKLRRYDLNILMGLTEEVNPAKDYESDDRGLTTKNNIYNNKNHSWKFEKQDIGLNDIIVSTTPFIDGHDILEYISIVTESTTVDLSNFSNHGQLQEQINLKLKSPEQDYYPFNSESEKTTTTITLNDIYQSLIEKCRAHAIDKKGNALVGINFQITPLVPEETLHSQTQYQITCSGSVVWVNKR